MGNGRAVVTAVVILDLSAASDTVDCDLLLEVLEKSLESPDQLDSGIKTT